jgi:hypothetical protein
MITLSMGYQEPQSPDTGDIFYPAMAANMVALNNHIHDGLTSQFLGSSSQTVASGSWAAAPIGGGIYRQTLTVPTGMSYDTCQVWFKLSTGETVYPSQERVTSTTFYVYTNDNSLVYTAFYR